MTSINKPHYVVEQKSDNDLEFSLKVIARFDYQEDADKLVKAKQIAHDLELQASTNTTKYNYFSVWREK
jgi:hypothetical protein